MMDVKDLLPIAGILIGWLLAEGSAFGKRAIERKRAVGRALSILYFLFLEMVQLKMAQERFKSHTQDVREWERLRQRSFEKYTVQDPEFSKKLDATADALGEYYPVEAYELRELVRKYQFLKSKNLNAFTASPDMYVRFLSSYEMGFLAYQYKLELIIRFLARKQSIWLWARIRVKFWRLRRAIPEGDIVFLQQLKGRTSQVAGSDTTGADEGMMEWVREKVPGEPVPPRDNRASTPSQSDGSSPTST